MVFREIIEQELTDSPIAETSSTLPIEDVRSPEQLRAEGGWEEVYSFRIADHAADATRMVEAGVRRDLEVIHVVDRNDIPGTRVGVRYLYARTLPGSQRERDLRAAGYEP